MRNQNFAVFFLKVPYLQLKIEDGQSKGLTEIFTISLKFP